VPQHGEGLGESGEGEALRLRSGRAAGFAAGEDGFDDVGGEEVEAPIRQAQGRQDARGVGSVNIETLGEIRHRGDFARVQHLLPTPGVLPTVARQSTPWCFSLGQGRRVQRGRASGLVVANDPQFGTIKT